MAELRAIIYSAFYLKKKKSLQSTFRKKNLHKTDHRLGEKRGLVGHTVSSQLALGKKDEEPSPSGP